MAIVIPLLTRSEICHAEVRECLNEFKRSGTVTSAERLRLTLLPRSTVYDSFCCPDGKWFVELRFDELLHDGKGNTEAAALVDVVLRVSSLIGLIVMSGDIVNSFL